MNAKINATLPIALVGEKYRYRRCSRCPVWNWKALSLAHWQSKAMMLGTVLWLFMGVLQFASLLFSSFTNSENTSNCSRSLARTSHSAGESGIYQQRTFGALEMPVLSDDSQLFTVLLSQKWSAERFLLKR